MLHPEVPDVAKGTGAVPHRGPAPARPATAPRARSAAQMEEDAEAARQRAGGAPASEWARRQTAEIRQVREELRIARKEAYGAEVPHAGGDGFPPQRGRARAGSRHNRPLSAAAPGRISTGAASPDGCAPASPERPRWLVPARGLNNKERVTAKERVFQERMEDKRRGLARVENNEAAMLREQAKRDAMLPWWERSEKDAGRRSANKLSAGGWYRGKPGDGSASPTKRSPARPLDSGRQLTPNDALREFQYPPPPKTQLKQPRAFSSQQVAPGAGRGGHDPVVVADLAEKVATETLLNTWGHALARLLEATAGHKRRHDYIAADGRMDLHEFRRLLRSGFEGSGPDGIYIYVYVYIYMYICIYIYICI